MDLAENPPSLQDLSLQLEAAITEEDYTSIANHLKTVILNLYCFEKAIIKRHKINMAVYAYNIFFFNNNSSFISFNYARYYGLLSMEINSVWLNLFRFKFKLIDLY